MAGSHSAARRFASRDAGTRFAGWMADSARSVTVESICRLRGSGRARQNLAARPQGRGHSDRRTREKSGRPRPASGRLAMGRGDSFVAGTNRNGDPRSVPPRPDWSSSSQGGDRADPRSGAPLGGLELRQQVRIRDRVAPATRSHGPRAPGPGCRRRRERRRSRMDWRICDRPSTNSARHYRWAGPLWGCVLTRHSPAWRTNCWLKVSAGASTSPTPSWGWRWCYWPLARRDQV